MKATEPNQIRIGRQAGAGWGGDAGATCGLDAQYHRSSRPHKFVFRPDRIMPTSSPFERDLDRNPANYTPLTPLSLIARAAYTYPHMLAVVHGERRYTWAETYARSRRLASRAARAGIGTGDTVAVMAANTPEMVEPHFGVPMAGGVLNTLNTRLDAETIAFMLEHGEAKVLRHRHGIRIHRREGAGPDQGQAARSSTSPTRRARAASAWAAPTTRRSSPAAIRNSSGSIRPTSGTRSRSTTRPGTTGNPKGVVYHHRGAYLNALSNIIDWGMPRHSVYLWTLPMFHCNGWCFAWTMAANAGTNVCLRRVEAKAVLDAIRLHKVTHYCGAPIVHGMLINAPDELKQGIAHKVHCLVAAAAPPAAMIEGMERIGFDITHVYGLTETYGPAAVCAKHGEWDALDIGARTERNGRQGVRYTVEEGMTVLDPDDDGAGAVGRRDDGRDHVPRQHHDEGLSQELRPRPARRSPAAGSTPATSPSCSRTATSRSRTARRTSSFRAARTSARSRSRTSLYRHPAVLAAAVVAQPDPKWGETPCAFVELKPGAADDRGRAVAHCQKHLARFKAPKKVVFGELPKTSTGKIQKFLLRDQARSTSAIE